MDYFQARSRANSSSQFPSLTTSTSNPTRRLSNGSSNPDADQPRLPQHASSQSQPPSSQAIRIRRLSSIPSVQHARDLQLAHDAPPRIPLPSPLAEAEERQTTETSKRRSLSEPQRPSSTLLAGTDLHRQLTAGGHLTPLNEEPPYLSASSRTPQEGADPTAPQNAPMTTRQPPGRLRRASSAVSSAWMGMTGQRSSQADAPTDIPAEPHVNNYDSDIVDLLDVIDPEVSTLTTLNNLQNSLFVPNLGSWLNRTPTYNLTWHGNEPPIPETSSSESDRAEASGQDGEKSVESVETPQDLASEPITPADQDPEKPRTRLKRSHTLTSHLSEQSGDGHNYAVLPHGVDLEGWSEQDKDELNDHVRHLLHSKREGFKRSMRAFGKYVRTPLGAFVTIYAFLVTFWGAAWVFFLIGWISAGGRQQYFIEVCDQVLTALFALVGDGLAPFRAIDTYHMIFIAKYHYKTWNERKKRGLPELEDPNDLPEYANYLPPPSASERTRNQAPKLRIPLRPMGAERPPSEHIDVEDAAPGIREGRTEPEAVLSPKEYRSFKHHQAKFQKSHTFYRPHETFSHHAFPIKLLIATVVLLDFHSIFQICLGGTTWGLYYKHRPKAVTAVILSCSICCNIAGGVVISTGDKKTRKKEVVETMFRQALTEEAMRKMHRQKGLKVPSRLQKGKEAKMAQKVYDHNVRKELAQELPKQSIDARRSMDVRRSLEVKRTLQVSTEPAVASDVHVQDFEESAAEGALGGSKTATELAREAVLRAARAKR